jgi:hypothetical protein
MNKKFECVVPIKLKLKKGKIYDIIEDGPLVILRDDRNKVGSFRRERFIDRTRDIRLKEILISLGNGS